MKFKDYEYVRPSLEKAKEFYGNKTKQISDAKDFVEVCEIIDEVFKFENNYSTMSSISYIRHSINTLDEFYDNEMEFFDQADPMFTSYGIEFAKCLLASPYKEEISNKYGRQWLDLLQLSLKTFDESITEELTIENKLSSRYSKLLASAKIEFDGKINNLSQMGIYTEDSNRDVRKEASLKVAQYFESIEDEVDEIYDSLVKVRDKIAKKLGYENFVDLGYARMMRTDYTSKDVANYRKQVYENLVSVYSQLIKAQAKDIKVEDIKYYDLGLKFLDGNPKPVGNTQDLVSKALNMYSKMSGETKEFFEFMVNHELLDLEAKEGKQGGGYCAYIPDFNSPFIFSNFNKTSGDVDVLTHEAGHAFQSYVSAKYVKNPQLYSPTYEACEIHSMSMEFLAYPYMEDFFKEDTQKYYKTHLTSAVLFIPYGVLVDEFQHFVYENPNCSIQDRKTKWRELEKKYTPDVDYDGVDVYERGCRFFRQGHIFTTPFYYIDYTLAQVVAFNIYLLDIKDHNEAWEKYYNLCKLGGSMSFTKLLEEVGLANPFKDGSIKEIVSALKPIIDKYL